MFARVNGLYGHVRRNNAKTAALFVLFLALVEAAQVALHMMPVAITTNISGQFDRAIEAERLREAARQKSVAGDEPSAIGSSVSRLQPTSATAASDPGQHIQSAQERKERPLLPEGLFSPELSETLETKLKSLFANPWLVALVAGLIYIIGACQDAARSMRRATGARGISREEAPDLYNLVENLAISVGLPCPAIEVIETPALNAYAAGFFPKSSTIALTRGLLQRLTRHELETVIAHELTHIRDRDVRLMTMARACSDLLPINAKLIAKSKEQPFATAMLGVLLLAYLGWTFAFIFAGIMLFITAAAFAAKFSISKSREFAADAGAIELTKNPEALIRALRKVSASDQLPVHGYVTRAMMFSATGESWFGTHPAIDERIAAIKQHAAVMEPPALPASAFNHAPDAASRASDVRRSRIVQGLGHAAAPMAQSVQRAPDRRAHVTPPQLPQALSRGDSFIVGPPVKAAPRATVPEPETGAERFTKVADAAMARVSKAYLTFFACMIAFGVTMSAMTVFPPLGMAFAAGFIYYGWRRVRGALARRSA